MKSNKGITLVTLIITIVVLLILAAITINMVAGQEGIMAKVSNAKTTQTISTFRNSVQSGVNFLGETANVNGMPTTENIKSEIKKDIDNSLKDMKVVFECKDGEGNIIVDETTAFPTNGTVKVTVTDAENTSTPNLKSANIQSIEVTIKPTEWKIENGNVTYVKPIDGNTNTTF